MKKLEVKAAGIHFCVEREPMESETAVQVAGVCRIYTANTK